MTSIPPAQPLSVAVQVEYPRPVAADAHVANQQLLTQPVLPEQFAR